jgi:hypothetical protein
VAAVGEPIVLVTREFTEVVVSIKNRCAVSVPVVGFDFRTILTVIVSETLSTKPLTVKTAAVVESAAAVAAVPFLTTVIVVPVTVACDGTTERTPKPNAATATSAMRLNVVFVDICFLSIVDPRTIRRSA